MFDGIGTELNLIIDNICEKLGTTVDALVPELCKYMVYKSIGYIVAFSMISIFIIIAMLVIFMINKKYESAELICLEMFLVASLFLMICCISYNVYYLIIWKNAPTGAVVNYLIDQLKNH